MGSWSNMHPKRSIERGSYEGFGMRRNVKRLKVDLRQRSHFQQVVKLKHGNERRGIAPSKSFGLSAPTHPKGRSSGQLVPYGKKIVDPTTMGNRTKLEMRPPKAITKAILVRMGRNGLSQSVHFNTQNRQNSSFESRSDSRPPDIWKEMPPVRLNPVSASRCKVLPDGMYDVERRPRQDIIQTDNDGMEMGFQYGEDARDNGLKDTSAVGYAESRDSKVTRFDKFKLVIPSAIERRLKDQTKSGINCSSQSNKRKSDLRRHLLGGNNRNGARSNDKEAQYDFERPNLTENDSCLITDAPKTECMDLGPSFGVVVTAKHEAKPTLPQTTYNLVGLKNMITSATESNYLESKLDKAKDSELNFAKGKSLTSSGGAGTVKACENSGIHNFSLAVKDKNDLSNIPYGDQEALCRNKVRKAVNLYKETLEKFQQEDKLKPKGEGKVGMQIYVAAAMQLKEQNKWLNVNKPVGAIPGIEVGDHFQYRAELVMVGLHRKFFAGIDYKKIDGETCATSIISSDLYGDINESADILTYIGEGNSKTPEDQKLMRGNLALKNSMNKVPVRVIRSCQIMKAPKSIDANIMKKVTYMYDGLFYVTDYRPEVVPGGRLVYKFQLKRIEGQQKLLGWRTLNGERKVKKSSYGPVVVDDISQGEEKMPIRVVNAIDCEKPPPFKYITKMMYMKQCVLSMPSGCDCIGGCSSEDIPCSCLIKNNCSVPSSDIVSVSENNPIVYECGPSCKCPPDCRNRVSQNGIKLQLEIFKTKSMRWGVRSRNFITAGRFVCEYVGELLQYNYNEERINFDKSDTGNDYGNRVSEYYPNMLSSSMNDDDDDFTENTKFGNVGRFIKHSCSPNLHAKCVLFDHEDKTRPHVMLFAAKNIAPLVELTFDYKLW